MSCHGIESESIIFLTQLSLDYTVGSKGEMDKIEGRGVVGTVATGEHAMLVCISLLGLS